MLILKLNFLKITAKKTWHENQQNEFKKSLIYIYEKIRMIVIYAALKPAVYSYRDWY